MEKATNISNSLKEQSYESNNLIEEIIFHAFNQPNIYIRSRSRPIKTIQPHKLDNKYMNINEPMSSTNIIKKTQRKYSSTEENLPTIKEIKENIKNKAHSHSSNSLYFKEYEKADFILDKNLLDQISKIENKIESIYSTVKIVPERVEEKIIKDVLDYFNKLKMLIENNLEEKIRNKFKLVYCKECEKVEYFYCFKDCFNCKEEFCLNNIILCRNCKQFFCKECFQKEHKCS